MGLLTRYSLHNGFRAMVLWGSPRRYLIVYTVWSSTDQIKCGVLPPPPLAIDSRLLKENLNIEPQNDSSSIITCVIHDSYSRRQMIHQLAPSQTSHLTKYGEMGCQKIILTNPCGHELKVSYAYCGRYHVNSTQANMACYESSKPIFDFGFKRYIVGSSYCGRVCKAYAQGWWCCSCNSRFVKGYVDPVTNLLVHKTSRSIPHALCNNCRV